jgi:hypothetical protein
MTLSTEDEGGWKWYTFALITFAKLQIFVWKPKYIYLALLSSIPVIFLLTRGVSRAFVILPLILALLTAYNERKATGYIRLLIIRFVYLFPLCDVRKDPLLLKPITVINVPMRQRRKILITGGTGFCGVQVVKYLVENYPDWQLVLVSRSKNRKAAIQRIHHVCNEHGIPLFPTESIEIVRGEFKEYSLGRTYDELDAIWKDIGVVFHFAICNSYILPYECNYLWNQNLELICRLCYKHGVQLHAMGGAGYHFLEDCEIPKSYHRSTWCNGYFQFKQFQRLLVEKYVDHGLVGCTYDLPYIFADVEPKSILTPSDYEVNLNIKFARHFGQVRSFDVAVITPRVVAEIIARHTEIAFNTGALEYKYMNLFVRCFNDDDLNRLANVSWAKSRAHVEETIRNTTINSDFMISVFRDLFPEFWVGMKCRPLVAPDWAKDILESVDGEAVFRKIVRQCDAEGFSLAKFKNPKRDRKNSKVLYEPSGGQRQTLF